MATLTDAQRTFLDDIRYAVVATINPDGMPQQTVLWYERQGDEIMMNTSRGRLKDDNLRRDPRISFCIEDEYRYLTLRGTATLIDDQEQAQEDITRLARRYTPDFDERNMAPFRSQERVTIRMRIDHIHSNRD
jgi:PPOX class probable F420-dependent enzyme